MEITLHNLDGCQNALVAERTRTETLRAQVEWWRSQSSRFRVILRHMGLEGGDPRLELSHEGTPDEEGSNADQSD